MRRLILLRHAKSDWPEGIADLERPLSARGRGAAPLMGRYLAREGLVPDRVLVSPARRTRETWDLVCAEVDGIPQPVSEPRIYEASAARLLGVLREQPDACHTLLLIGHNPGFEGLADTLVQHGSAAARGAMEEKFPTGAVAVIDLPVDKWAEIVPETGRLDRFVTPRMLAGET